MKNLLIVIAGIVALATKGVRAEMPRLDSSKFDFCYEFINSPAAEDLDGNGKKDMTINGGDSWLTCCSGDAIGYANFNCGSTSRFIGSNQSADVDGGVWRRYGITRATGFTIEVRVQVKSVSGSVGAIAVSASPSEANVNALLNFKDGAITWGCNITVETDVGF